MGFLQGLSTKENWPIKNIMSQQLKYYGHIKGHSGIESTVNDGRVSGRRVGVLTNMAMDTGHSGKR